MKRLILILSLCLLLSLSVVFALLFNTEEKMHHKYNSFLRTFVNDFLQPIDTLNLKSASYYFAGNTDHTIYLGNHRAFSHMVVINNNDLSDTSHIRLRFDSLRCRSERVTVDSPYFYLADGTVPFIHKGHLSDRKATFYMDSLPFIYAYPISNQSMGLLALSNRENTLVKITKGDPEIKLSRDILEEQGDGIFSTDGTMCYDKKNGRFAYLYFYRNQYIYMDTSFNLLRRGNTIDTISQAKIKVGEISSENSVSMAAPPLLVNNLSALSGNYLYVNSNILARNENVQKFERQSVVDMYDLISGTYRLSFYIPRYSHWRLRSFVVLENGGLVALYDHHLVMYGMNLSFAKGQAQNLKLKTLLQ